MGQLNEISQLASTFVPGADLWAVPFSPHSTWFKKLNWYTSSQMTLWVYKKQPTFSDALKKVIKDEQMPFSDQKTLPENNVLVYTQNIFPNKGILALNVDVGLQNWLVELHKKATELNLNTIRIFWGSNQIEDFLKGLMAEQHRFENFQLEVVTCEPDPL